MSTIRLQAQCPNCKRTENVKSIDKTAGIATLVKHGSYYRGTCHGVTVPVSAVAGWVNSEIARCTAVMNKREERENQARAELAAKLARIALEWSAARDETEALRRLLKRCKP